MKTTSYAVTYRRHGDLKACRINNASEAQRVACSLRAAGYDVSVRHCPSDAPFVEPQDRTTVVNGKVAA